MFRKYGLLGALMIAFAELNFIFKIEPFASWYFPIIWFGYIFLIDSLVYKLRKHSLMHNDRTQFLFLMFLSAIIWWIYEILNISTSNWIYVGEDGLTSPITLFIFAKRTLAFSTVLPAFFETFELFKTLNLFSHAHLKKAHKITKTFLFMMVGFGVFSLAAQIIAPKIFYPLIWFAFFFILDPINYLHKQQSIIRHLEDKRLQIPAIILLSGITLGVLWEFWNYWAMVKWTYIIPYVGFLKIFEMPILGYLGYLPFALSLYAMYYFVYSLFKHKGHLLQHKF
ncbi:MAG TPA: hypothetical protein HA224_04830 [Nanoarchaeota archaeon]|nr:hypothetical protein [Nanoarchaeota archaeon]